MPIKDSVIPGPSKFVQIKFYLIFDDLDRIVDFLTWCDLIGDRKAHAILSFVSSQAILKPPLRMFNQGST